MLKNMFGLRCTILVTCVIFLCKTMWSLPISEAQVQQALETLDEELANRAVYVASRQSRVDSLTSVFVRAKGDDCRRLDIAKELADEYVAFNADSALSYCTYGYDRAVALGLDSVAVSFRLHRAAYLPLVGFVEDAVDEYESVNAEGLSVKLQVVYHDTGRQLYAYLASFYSKYPEENKYWRGFSTKSQSSLLELLDKDSDRYMLNLGESYYLSGEYGKAWTLLRELLGDIPENSNMYARASHILSAVAKARGDENGYVYYLARSATADVKSATLEMMSLQELGSHLFECGDVGRAHYYLSVALDYAVRCNAMMRMVQSSQAMPIIADAHEAARLGWQQKVYASIIGLSVLLVVLVATLLFLRLEMKRMAVLQSNLKNANHTKDVYIGQFLNLCSIYMDKLNQFSKIVNRKIAAGKIDDLFRMTKSGRFVEEQSREFYEVFDNAFLHIYPTFVSDVNALLRSDEQIILPEGELLNTDLRILAFMRLGVEESTRIAQVLNYSVNTIYTYRNKLKNKAVNRDTFETDIMKISSVS